MENNKKIFLISGIVGGLALISFLTLQTDTSNNELVELEPIRTQSSKNPAENYPEEERDTHCGTQKPKSNSYIKEFEIPTPCTQPVGIVVDEVGKIWFTETNTGSVGMFDPKTESFVEYENEFWPDGIRAMMWGIGYTDDNEIWFTDEGNDALWKFSIDDKKYSAFPFPQSGNGSMPQKLIIKDGKFFINDFTGSKISIIDHKTLDDTGEVHSNPIQTTENVFVGPPALTNTGEMWFVAWKYTGNSSLIKFDSKSQNATIVNFGDKLKAPNGLSIDENGDLWVSDTATSYFYKFDTESHQLTKYTTSFPREASYGNSSGLIKTPISRPYWNLIDEQGKLWFNEQTANMLAVFDPKDETLVEYLIPSKNPKWADCEGKDDCGLAQAFGFVPVGDKLWFTEWVENNIAVLDTSVPLPASIEIEPKEMTLKKGEKNTMMFTVRPHSEFSDDLIIASTITENDVIKISKPTQLVKNNGISQTIPIDVIVNDHTDSGTYKVLIGVEHPEVTVSKFFTVNVL